MAVREVKLQISASASDADQARQKLVSGFQQAAQQINRSFNSINKLDGLRSNIAATGSQLDRLRNELRDVGAEILRTSNNGARLEALKSQYRGLHTEISGLERGLAKSREQARALETSLRAAGLSTTQFGAARAQVEAMAQSLRNLQTAPIHAQNLFGGIAEAIRAQQAEVSRAAQFVIQQAARAAHAAASQERASARTVAQNLFGALGGVASEIQNQADSAATAARFVIQQAARAANTAAQQERATVRAAAQNLFGGIGDVARSQAGIQAEIAALRQRNALVGAGTELERLERNIVLGKYAAYTPAQVGHLRLLAAEYDQKQALLRVERERVATAAAQRASLGNFAQGALSVGGFGFGLGAVGAGIAAAGTAVFASQQALEFERAQAAITAVTGSLVEARTEMAFVREQANRLGINVTDLARSWAQLQAASKGSALEGEAARQVFLAVSESAQRLNLRSFETEGALRAIGQMMSKGTVQAEELRGQLGDRLPGAFNIMARALNVSTAELGEMLKKGQVVSSEALPKFAEELRKTFGTDATTRIDTTTAAFTRLTNEVKLTAAAAGGAMNPALKEGSNILSDILLMARERPLLTSMFTIAPGLLPAFRGIADNIRESATEAERLRKAVDSVGLAVETVNRITAFDPFARSPAAPNIPMRAPTPGGLSGVDLLTTGVIPVDEENLRKLREKAETVALTTELAKTEWSIRNGELATVSRLEQAEARRLAIAQDAVNAQKQAKKDDKQGDKALRDAEKLFKDNLAVEAKRIEEQGELRRRLNVETLEAQGNDTQAALARLHDQYLEFQKDLADSAEGLDLTNKWFNAGEAQIALRGIQEEVEKAVAQLQARIQGRDLRAVTAGPGERDRLQRENLADVLGVQAAIDKLRETGEMFGGSQNEGFTGAMEAATAAVRTLGVEISRQADGPIAELFRDWEDWTLAAEHAGARWIESSIDGIAQLAARGSFDFRSMAESIIQDIIRIQLQSLASGIAGSGFGQALGGFFGGMFGGGAPTGGIDWANQTPTGPVLHQATGGYISGPGTGTSDSIPAWLSNGEFVINAKAVRGFGRGFFEMLNRGHAPGARRFADGGYVGGGAAMSGGTRVEVHNYTGAQVRTERTQQGGVDVTKLLIGALESDMAQNGPISRKFQRNFGLQPAINRR